MKCHSHIQAITRSKFLILRPSLDGNQFARRSARSVAEIPARGQKKSIVFCVCAREKWNTLYKRWLEEAIAHVLAPPPEKMGRWFALYRSYKGGERTCASIELIFASHWRSRSVLADSAAGSANAPPRLVRVGEIMWGGAEAEAGAGATGTGEDAASEAGVAVAADRSGGSAAAVGAGARRGDDTTYVVEAFSGEERAAYDPTLAPDLGVVTAATGIDAGVMS